MFAFFAAVIPFIFGKQASITTSTYNSTGTQTELVANGPPSSTGNTVHLPSTIPPTMPAAMRKKFNGTPLAARRSRGPREEASFNIRGLAARNEDRILKTTKSRSEVHVRYPDFYRPQFSVHHDSNMEVNYGHWQDSVRLYSHRRTRRGKWQSINVYDLPQVIKHETVYMARENPAAESGLDWFRLEKVEKEAGVAVKQEIEDEDDAWAEQLRRVVKPEPEDDY